LPRVRGVDDSATQEETEQSMAKGCIGTVDDENASNEIVVRYRAVVCYIRCAIYGNGRGKKAMET
jgi:hypothetical protein